MMRRASEDSQAYLVGSVASISNSFAPPWVSEGRLMPLSSKSWLGKISVLGVSGFELAIEQIVFIRRERKYGTRENMARLDKKMKIR